MHLGSLAKTNLLDFALEVSTSDSHLSHPHLKLSGLRGKKLPLTSLSVKTDETALAVLIRVLWRKNQDSSL